MYILINTTFVSRGISLR